MEETTISAPLPQPGEGGDDTGIEMTLWTRQPVCGARADVLDRLGELRSSGAIDGFTVETWPDAVRLDDAATHEEILATVDRFRAWATDHDRRIEPAFQRRTVSPLLGSSYRLLRLPMMALAVHDEDGLAGVYPSVDGDRTTTVPEFLSAYDPAPESPTPRVTSTDAA